MFSSGSNLQSLARLGGSITGVDASREAILAAQLHASGDESLAGLLNYRHGTAESLQAQGAKSWSHKNPAPAQARLGTDNFAFARLSCVSIIVELSSCCLPFPTLKAGTEFD